MNEVIRQRALELGFDECRFTTVDPPDHAGYFQHWLEIGFHGEMGYLARNASKRMDPRLLLPGARSLIVLVASYGEGQSVHDKSLRSEVPRHAPSSPPPLAPRPPSPAPSLGFVARYARFADYHQVLRQGLQTLIQWLNRIGGTGTVSRAYVDTGPLLERDLAQRAGAGFIGKHTNLIHRQFGNWLFLAEIITSLELEPDPPERNRCGTCVRCLRVCPTQAIVAPFQLDARRCLSYFTIEFQGAIPLEFRPALGNRVFGCDDCLAVCPWNRFAQEGRLMRDCARADLAAPDLLELLALDENGFRQRFGGTPLERPKRRGLRRNVCIALGNVGDGSALNPLAVVANDPDPLVAEHAAWAIERIQSRFVSANT